MDKIDWKSMPTDEFEREMASAMEAALGTLRKNKGGRWKLESHRADDMGGESRFACEVYLPTGPTQRLFVHASTADNPLSLPLVYASNAELQELRKRVSEKEFLIACLATWLYRYAIYYHLR